MPEKKERYGSEALPIGEDLKEAFIKILYNSLHNTSYRTVKIDSLNHWGIDSLKNSLTSD